MGDEQAKTNVTGATGEDATHTGNVTGGEPGAPAQPGNEGVKFSAEQQKAVDAIISERLSRARKSWQEERETQAKKEVEEAERLHLQEQAEWQKLAERHEAKVKELEPRVKELTASLEAYEKVIGEMLTARVKALGEKAKAAVEALPGAPGALAKLQWLNANEALFGEGSQQIGTPRRGGRGAQQQGQAQGQQPPARPLVKF